MKKKYSVTLEFSAEVENDVSIEQQRKFPYFDLCLAELLKNNRVISDIYKNLLVCDLAQETNPFKINIKDFRNEVKDEAKMLAGVIKSLKGNPKRKLLELLEGDDKIANMFFEEIFDLFGELQLDKFIFSEQ